MAAQGDVSPKILEPERLSGSMATGGRRGRLAGGASCWHACSLNRRETHCARHASLRRLDSSTAAPPMRKMQPGMHMLRCLPR